MTSNMGRGLGSATKGPVSPPRLVLAMLAAGAARSTSGPLLGQQERESEEVVATTAINSKKRAGEGTLSPLPPQYPE